MQKITDLTQLSGLLSPFLQKGVFTNNFLMLPDYEKYLSQGLLYYTQTETGVLLFHRRHTHWQLYYFLKRLNASFALPQDKPTVMEIVSRANVDSFASVLAFWEKNGFQNRLPRKRMQAFAPQTKLAPAREVNFARHGDAKAVLELIKASFDPYLGCIPTQAEIEQKIAQGEVICCKEADKLQGVLEFARKGNTFFIWHLAVSPQFRRQGVARKLLAFLSALMQREGKRKIQLWVQTTNLAARKLYEQSGFHDDGWESAGLLYLPKTRKE
ncbi:MAG: GNAT family N-acetyltransferase [Firmicutes bacterium]|nr:GNAT family N-acetyltransferase [Bacillota bacterium]